MHRCQLHVFSPRKTSVPDNTQHTNPCRLRSHGVDGRRICKPAFVKSSEGTDSLVTNSFVILSSLLLLQSCAMELHVKMSDMQMRTLVIHACLLVFVLCSTLNSVCPADLRVGSFNIQVLGQSKMKKKAVVDILVKVLADSFNI